MFPLRNDTRRPAPAPFGLGGAIIGSAAGIAGAAITSAAHIGGAAMVTTIGIGTAITDPLSQQLARLITIFVPPGVGGSILEVAKIVYNEFSGEILLTDIKIAMSLVTIMQGLSRKPVYETRKFTPAEDRPIAVRFSRYMKYALAAYGSFLYNPLQSDADFILHTTRLPRNKVYPYVDERAVSGKAMLEHFVAIDDHERSVVVSLKGSATLEAFLKDARLLYAEADLWGQRFHVHEGMWQAAQGLVQFPLLMSQIKEALMLNPGYKVVVLGHSLGGGVAILLACLLADPDGYGNFVTNDRTLPGRRIECYGFEPAASVDEELRQVTKSMTYSIVNKNDIVPFLSHGALRDFGAMARYLKGNTLYLASIADGLLKNQAHPEAFMANFRALAKHKKLVPPGRVWLIDVVDYGDLQIVEILNVGERFAELRFILGMVHDHLLPNCLSSMDRLRGIFE